MWTHRIPPYFPSPSSPPVGLRRGPLGCHPRSCAVTLHTLLVSPGSALGAGVKARQGIAVWGLERPQQFPPNISSLSPQQTSLDALADGGLCPHQRGAPPVTHPPPLVRAQLAQMLSSQSSQGAGPSWSRSSLLEPELTVFQPSSPQELSPQ